MDEGLFQGDIVTSKRILYTPSPFARNALLYLQETGELKAKKPHVSHRQGLASYLFLWCWKGMAPCGIRTGPTLWPPVTAFFWTAVKSIFTKVRRTCGD